ASRCFFNPHVCSVQRSPKKDAVLMPQHTPIRSDATDVEVAGIVEPRQTGGHRAGRGRVVVGGRGVTQRLMRPLVVVEPTKVGEAPLLRARGGGGRPRGVRLEDLVKLLMRGVFLGT